MWETSAQALHALCILCGEAMRRNKYGAVRVEAYGIKFASKREYRRYQELLLLERLGHILDLRSHPSFDLWAAGRPRPWLPYTWMHCPNVKIGRYTADSTYVVVDAPGIGAPGEVIVEDVKSRPTLTEAARLRMKLYTANTGEVIRLEF